MNAKLAKKLKNIEATKKEISVLRDRLRQEFSDLEDILETLDYGTASIESGLRDIEFGIDSVSKYL